MEMKGKRVPHIGIESEMKPYVLPLRIVSYHQGNEAISQLQCKEAIDATATNQ